MIETLERGRLYIIEGPNGKKYRRNRAHLKPLCHDGSSFLDPPKAKRQIPIRHDNVDSFQDPRPRTKKSVTFEDYPIIFESIKPTGGNLTSNTKPKSHSSHHVHSPRSPSSSPPAHFSPREHLVNPTQEDHTTPKQHKII